MDFLISQYWYANILVNNDTDNISVVHWSKQSEHGLIDIKYSLGVPRSLTGFYSHPTVDKNISGK